MNPGCDQTLYAGQRLRIPKSTTSTDGIKTFHTIQSGETLYRLTVIYNVSAKSILDANPGLSAENFRVGQVVRIPNASATATATAATSKSNANATPTPGAAVKSRCRTMHTVKRKETIFSICKEYGVTQQELTDANPEIKSGLKKGDLLCIPYPTKATTPKTTVATSDSELFRDSERTAKRYTTIKAALLLPFTQDKRMVEYYEGFLLAVDSLKRSGVSMDLYVRNLDDSATTLTNLLARDEMKDMNIIFGPVQSKHTQQLAKFAKQNGITLVIPFSSKEDVVLSNSNVYQINTPQSYLYSEVNEHFTRQFSNANVIFLDAGTGPKVKKEFVESLKSELKSKGISYKALPENSSVEGLKSAIATNKNNIFIPTSSSDVSLIHIIPNLTMLVRSMPEVSIQLFGYPEWQTYTKDHLESFFELDTYFYSSFYTNNLLPAAVNFTKAYQRCYKKEMENSYPKYGMLGFDTGYFFLKGLSLYGSKLDKNLGRMNDIRPIQTGFKFQRANNWGGFINRKVFFVHFNKQYELVKIDFE
jgi:LysM repeat protein/ABC-type branched-subunit amino acid transport system substrate-binding protein